MKPTISSQAGQPMSSQPFSTQPVSPGSHSPEVTPPLAWLSHERVDPSCLQKRDLYAILDCWLNAHPTIAAAITWRNATFEGDWTTWPAWLQEELHQHFGEMVEWYGRGMPSPFPSPFPMPLLTGLTQQPNFWGPRMMEYLARTVYLSYVGNALAAELTGFLPWSITTYSDQNLCILLGANDLVPCWLPPDIQYPGYYLNWGVSPATPGYVVSFFKANSLIGSSALDTVARLFEWGRCLDHYHTTLGESSCNYEYFWGPYSPPIPASYVIDGTEYTGPDAKSWLPGVKHWTAGCGGTTEFFKSILRAVNIPVDPRKCGASTHRAPFFPTIDRGLSHGDDPYDDRGIVSRYRGWPVPTRADYLITGARWEELFDARFDMVTCDHHVARHMSDIAIQYQSDVLLQAYCKDLASHASHADGQVFKTLDDNCTLDELEALNLWDKLEAKAKAIGLCK